MGIKLSSLPMRGRGEGNGHVERPLLSLGGNAVDELVRDGEWRPVHAA